MVSLSSKRAGLPFAGLTIAMGVVACAPYAGSSSGGVDTEPAQSASGGGGSPSTVYGASAGDDADGAADDAEGGAEASDDAVCQSMAGDACLTCCEDDHPDGAKVRDDAYHGCICEACQWACALTLCGVLRTAPKAGDACDTCVRQAGTCEPAIDAACAASVDCAAFEACGGGCH